MHGRTVISSNTQACNSNANQLFSIYTYKADGRVMACNKSSVKEGSSFDTCTQRFYTASGAFISSKTATCYLSATSGTCIHTNSGTDVRLSPTIIDQTFDIECGLTCKFVQNFYDGKLRWKSPDNNNLFTINGAFVKANNGRYLKRLSTNIVSVQDLVSTDNNFKWFLY